MYKIYYTKISKRYKVYYTKAKLTVKLLQQQNKHVKYILYRTFIP